MNQAEKDFRSDRVAFLAQSEIRAMTRECKRVGGLNLGQGVCPLPSPPQLLQAASEAILADQSTYSRFDGIEMLRQAIASKLSRYNGLDVDADGEIIATVGAAGAFTCALQGLFDVGDEIIVFEPFYGYHVNAIRVSGCQAKVVSLGGPEWTFEPAQLEDVLTSHTRAVLINTPANPSGKVFGPQELAVIADFCRTHDLLAITDEIYEYMVFDGHRHISIATLPGMWERTVTISGFSKTFAITGWRLGYAAAPPHLADPIGLVNDLFYICPPTPLQHALAHGLEVLEQSYYDEMSEKYRRNRDLFCEALKAAGLRPFVPQGAYYVLADISRLGCGTSKEGAMKLLEEVGVASVPGDAFFASEGGRQLVRFCVAQPLEVLEEAAERIASYS